MVTSKRNHSLVLENPPPTQQGDRIKIAIKVCFMVTPQPLSPLKNKKRIFVVEMDLPVTDMVPFIQHLLRRQVDQLRRIADLEQENA